MRRRWAAVLILSLGLLAAGMYGAEGRLTPEEVSDLYSQAKDKFRDAAQQAKTNPRAAAALFEESILRYRRLIEEGGLHNGKLYYNIGNACVLEGDLGRAILNYRRAERLMPEDRNLQANLEFARGKVRDQIPLKPRRRIMETLFFWHYDFSPALRLTLLAVAFNLIWLLALLKLVKRVRASLRAPIVLLAVVSALLLGSLIVEHVTRDSLREGVIVATEAVGRKGPDAAGYEPSFKEPLHEGVECEILEDRQTWTLVRLNDGRETWLPSSALERV